MQIFLHKLDGTQDVVNINQSSTIESLIQQSGSRLIYQGCVLSSLETLCQNANVYITGDLDGGKKKKKKKVYTTKKKNKHIHKKNKLLPLTLYGFDKAGNVIQQRKPCPSCGPGTCMAQHWDRYYCGLCHTTIKMDPETVKKNYEKMIARKEALEAERKAKQKEAADKGPAGKGKKDAKKKKK